MKQTCQTATCFFIATLFDHMAHNIIVIVDQRYVAKTIANDGSADKIPDATIASVIMNTRVHDWTKIVNNNPRPKKNQGLIST